MFSDLDRFGSLVIGPGLGRDEGTIAAARELIADATLPVVIDGDGIFAAAWSADGAGALLRPRGRPTVITPTTVSSRSWRATPRGPIEWPRPEGWPSNSTSWCC